MAKQITCWQADDGSMHQTEDLAHFADAFNRFLRDVDSEEIYPGCHEAAEIRRALLGSIGEDLAICILRVRAPHLLSYAERPPGVGRRQVTCTSPEKETP